MDKVCGNYLTQSNMDFPMDCETLDYIAQNHAMLEALGNIGGDKIVLSGCTKQNGGATRSEGFVFVRTTDFPNGEVLRWEGGAVGNMYVKKEDVSVTADGYSYPKAYTRRSLAAGMGTETFKWSDFTDLKTNKELAAQIVSLQQQLDAVVAEPLGIVKMWAGTTVPEGYILCDGTEYKKTDERYKDLYAAIGDTFNKAPNRNGTVTEPATCNFRVPDLSGRFIVGYSSGDTEYNAYGKTGGEKKHTLSIAEMPSHTHEWLHGQEVDDSGSGGSFNEFTLIGGTVPGAIGSTGGSQSHENRPPYYVLAYIMKYKK